MRGHSLWWPPGYRWPSFWGPSWATIVRLLFFYYQSRNTTFLWHWWSCYFVLVFSYFLIGCFMVSFYHFNVIHQIIATHPGSIQWMEGKKEIFEHWTLHTCKSQIQISLPQRSIAISSKSINTFKKISKRIMTVTVMNIFFQSQFSYGVSKQLTINNA